jgi:1A family penicillin-binding protein
MAKSKQQKRKKQQRQTAFYETMPISALPPVLPELRQHLTTGAETAWETGQSIGTDLWQNATAGGAAIWERRGTATLYGTAAAQDIGAFLARCGQALSSRRMRAMALATGGAAALTLTIVGTNLVATTINRYSAIISSPAAVLSNKKSGTTIVDRNGVVLYNGYGAELNTVIPLSDVPQNLKNATLAAEDPSFYDHSGFSLQATARAAWVDITKGSTVEGGSTLTQQLVKNAILTSTKTFERKCQELVLAMDLESRYSKDQILGMYLNEVYYGQGSNGVEAAAQSYFRKPAHSLSLSESAFIAGLPLGPSRFDPNLDPASAVGRRNYVLDRMASLHMITSDQAKNAKAEPLNAQARDASIKAPHFVFYVLNELRKQYSDDVIEQGGITVKTTLDYAKQEKAQAIVAAQIDHLAGHNATNGGLISMDTATGDIIAMVGSKDYNAPGFGAVNVTLANLQPGSSFKPIAYVTAFMKGWNGSTQVEDKPISEPNGDGTFYKPLDYDLKFRGTVTLRRALANSLNIPAVEVLKFAGIPQTLDMAHKLGITSLNDPSRYGLSLVLGGGEVRPIDMATVYGTFANQGINVKPRAILKVNDRFGKDITKDTQPKPVQVIEAKYAAMITNILSDNTARTEEFGANSPLKLSRPAAAKTGTTNDFRDNWTVGYTPSVVTAVWVGNNDHSAMNNVDGITGAAPIWHDYMEMALAGTPVENFTIPADLTGFHVCASGGLAGDSVPGYTEVAPTDAPITRQCAAVPALIPTPTSSTTPQPSPDPNTPNTIPTNPVGTPIPTAPVGPGKLKPLPTP